MAIKEKDIQALATAYRSRKSVVSLLAILGDKHINWVAITVAQSEHHLDVNSSTRRGYNTTLSPEVVQTLRIMWENEVVALNLKIVLLGGEV